MQEIPRDDTERGQAVDDAAAEPDRGGLLEVAGRDGDLADPIVSTRFAMAYLRDIMTRRPTLREALTEYNGGPGGRHLQYYRAVMGAYVEILERPELQCRYRPTPKQPPPSLGLLSQI